MTVVASPKDTDGVLLQSNITALVASIAATSSTVHKYQLQCKLDQLQRELVAHFLDVNRISAATVLSTLS